METDLDAENFLLLQEQPPQGTVLTSSPGNELSFEIAVTDELAEVSEQEQGSREYIHRLVDSWINQAVQPLMPETNLHIKYSEQEPNVDEDAEEAIREWREASDDGVHSSLLITSDQYDRGVGLAEEAETPRDRSVALVGEGYDFLETGQEEWRETVPVIEYEVLEREMNYTPWKTVIAALHEIGHTLGLDHKDGEIYEVDGLEASVMAASYTTEYTDVRFSDNIYWRTEFSEKAENSIN